MSHCTRLLFLLLALIAAAARAETSLENAWRARALLGTEIWSKVITIHNETRGGRYPETLHALVFELTGILWFYTDVDGTQSFSLHRGRLDEEKGDFGPLLRDIESGFLRWSEAEEPARTFLLSDEPLRNGCFIESVAAWRQRIARGLRTEEPRLLSYYADTAAGQKGHTVLSYRVGNAIEVFDPDRSDEHLVFSDAMALDPLVLARALNGREVSKARYLPVGGDGMASNALALMVGHPRSKTDAAGGG